MEKPKNYTMADQANLAGKRLIIPNFRTEFCSLLQRRLHGVLEHFFELNNQFTLLINTIDRTSQESLATNELVYAGAEEMIGSLEKNMEGNGYHATLIAAGDDLRTYTFPASKGAAGGTLYDQFRKGDLALEDIKEGNLKDYFTDFEEKKKKFGLENLDHIGPEYEHPILSHYFNIEEDKYISVPLIQFGTFDGVVHIIYKAKYTEDVSLPYSIRRIIRLFTLELESLLLDFDVVGQNVYRQSLLRYELEALEGDDYYEMNQNPILRELKYQQYYRNNRDYFLARIRQNDEVPKLLIDQHRKNAIMSILIDSYAHNISAHSLTALNWWFFQRASRQMQEEGRNADGTLMALTEPNPDISVITSNKPLSGEIHPLIKLLLEKGAFWTGLTRDRHFGGQIKSLFTILRYDFVNNPLYLGTIAFSEGILKLNINITIYDEVELKDEGILRKKRIKRNESGELLHGRFVSIDLENINYAPDKLVDPNSLNNFVLKGDKFDALAEALKEVKVFLPGGVIGKHAFFTILENEIRNVKHYDEAVIKQMQKEGLTLSLSVQQASYNDETEFRTEHEHELYQIGVWLNHPTYLNQQLLRDRLDKLSSDIIEEDNFRPKLGGTYQDKVCSALLMNNTFLSVQDNATTKRDEKYYPWIKTGSGKLVDDLFVEDYEISLRRVSSKKYAKSVELFNQNFEEGPGYFKKFFHIWKGTNIFTPDKLDDLKEKWENLSRFRFAYIPEDDMDSHKLAKNAGLIRIINNSSDSLELAYRAWLSKWLKTDESIRLMFKIKKQNVAQLIYDEKGLRYLNNIDLKELSDEEMERFQGYTQMTIPLAHKASVKKQAEVCRYRSHGILQSHFANGNKLEIANMPEEFAAELFEMLLTNVCVFDNRIANRVGQSNLETLRESLNCAVYQEKINDWNRERELGFSRYHFLVVHLSFIEAFRDENSRNKKYSENDIGAFIQEEILKDKNINLENFTLVITTGRGRTQWWTNLEENPKYVEYTNFTTFRPVESLIKSIEQAVSMGDDFEMKYRLTKVLFGS